MRFIANNRCVSGPENFFFLSGPLVSIEFREMLCILAFLCRPEHTIAHAPHLICIGVNAGRVAAA
jgi:hypothetical protein